MTEHPAPIDILHALSDVGVRLSHGKWNEVMNRANAYHKERQPAPLPPYDGNDPLKGVLHDIRAMRRALNGEAA